MLSTEKLIVRKMIIELEKNIKYQKSVGESFNLLGMTKRNIEKTIEQYESDNRILDLLIKKFKIYCKNNKNTIDDKRLKEIDQELYKLRGY